MAVWFVTMLTKASIEAEQTSMVCRMAKESSLMLQRFHRHSLDKSNSKTSSQLSTKVVLRTEIAMEQVN